MMRGISRQAVQQNTPIKGTTVRAADVANTKSLCRWNPDMYGVDMSKPGAQAYYNSLMELVASWEVDFIKVDDLSRPYHQAEIGAIRKAIDKTGRAIVFSTSPGETPLSAGPHINQNANMWRISDDFGDGWPQLLSQFKRLHDWTPHRVPGAWPDADMLPLGIVKFTRPTRFTRDGANATVPVKLADLGFSGVVQVRDLWEKKDIEPARVEFAPDVPAHGARLFCLTPTH